ncbi:MAG: nardilysin [Bacillariaceae sp.]|jgi:nardilysin
MDHDDDDASSKKDNKGILIGPDLNPTRSPFDKKNYRQILLPNGLRALLVSDVVAMTQAYNLGGGLMMDDDDDDDSSDDDDDDDDDMDVDDEDDADEEEEGGGLRNAAAAMVVGTGSFYDPPECQGMAHFLEHLLFMGSQKFPEENSYDAYMSKHGGNDNAYTESEHTVYHFEIPQEQLSGALDMFSQFFVSPLLKESSVARELKAIESEFMSAKNSDGSRSQQLMAYTCGRSFQEHPSSKFGWGNHHS